MTGCSGIDTCNNRVCCNHNHLVLGTASENTMYMLKCDRVERGEDRYNAKVTKEDVMKIYKLHDENPKILHREIAKMFGITNTHLSQILLGNLWRHEYEEYHKKKRS